MSETFTTTYGDWTITVSLYRVDEWRYIATRQSDMYQGTVKAYNRVDAVGMVKTIILIAEG